MNALTFGLRLTFAASLPLLFSACTILEPRQDPAELHRQQELAREREQRRFYEEQHRKVSRNQEDLDGSLYKLQQDVTNLRSDLARTQAQDAEQQNNRIAELEQKLIQMERQRKQDRDEIIDTLTKRVSDIMKVQAAENARHYKQTVAASGAEHIVGRGENLSAIAAAYGVPVQAVIRANRISDPNALRVGQKLIIPR